MQEAMEKALGKKETLALVLKTLLGVDDYNTQSLAFMELSAAGTNIVPMLVNELRPLKEAERIGPLLVCLGRIGPDAKAAIPMLVKFLNDQTYDEAFRIELRVVMANLGYQAPGFMAQIQFDITNTNSIKSRNLEGVAVHRMASIRPRGWVQGDVTSQVVKALKMRGSTPVTAIIVLGNCGKGQSNAIHALRKLQTGLKDEPQSDISHAVIGFARYRVETKDREVCLRDGLRRLGTGLIGEFAGLILISHCLVDDEMLQRIMERLEDSETAVRVGASRTLTGIGLPGKKAIPKLLELGKTSTSAEERAWAFLAIGTMASADVLPELEQGLQREQDDSAKNFIRLSMELIRHDFTE